MVADAREYFCLVLSLQRLPTHNKYLVLPQGYSQATHMQVLGALKVPILPLPPHTPTHQEQQQREANITCSPPFFAGKAARALEVTTDPAYIPI